MDFAGIRLIHQFLDLCEVNRGEEFDLTLAIDTPLGWPKAMMMLASGGAPVRITGQDSANSYTRRVTEIDLIEKITGAQTAG